MAEGKTCTCICQAIKNCVTTSAGGYKVIFGEGMKVTVNSGRLKIISYIYSVNGFVIFENVLWTINLHFTCS